MFCERCCDSETNDIIVSKDGAIRYVLREIGCKLVDLCRDLDIDKIKIKVYKDYDTGATIFKAKVNGEKVLEITADDFSQYYEN